MVPDPHDLTELSLLIPGYQLTEYLDQGGMGTVYKAIQLSLDRVVAIKVLTMDQVRRPAFVERFKREARALAKLNHNNIVSVHHYGESEGRCLYYVMEYIKGHNLRQYLQERSVNVRRILTFVLQICDALQYAHDEGVVHRDIKPANILIDPTGRIKVADFGLAKIMLPKDSQIEMLTMPFETIGTPDYIAPEILKGSPNIDHRADIYSLGVMLYEMLTGRLPKGTYQAPSTCGLDGRLDLVLEKALQQDPALRFQQVKDLTATLQQLMQTIGLPSVTGEKVEKKPEEFALPARANSRLWISVVPLVLVLGGGAFWKRENLRQWLGPVATVSTPATASVPPVAKAPDAPAPVVAVTPKPVDPPAPASGPRYSLKAQMDLALWVFDHQGLINITTPTHKEKNMRPEDDVRERESLPVEDFCIWRAAFPGKVEFGDDELAAFAKLAHEAGTLENLNLFGTSVTAAGLKALPQLSSALLSLGLQQTEAVTDQSLSYIGTCRQLKNVLFTLQAPDPNNDLIEKLKAVLPGCAIRAN